MAGHNKWSKIKHKKGVQDAKRSKVWTKIIREITVAAKLGGEDVSSNPRLRKAVDDARSANMPKDNIQRAIQKGSSNEAETLEELTYEGYGPGGVALVILCMTDNRNRTNSEVRTIVQKKGGNIGTPGSVMFSFKKKGQIFFEKAEHISEDNLLNAGIDHGAIEINEDEDGFYVLCEPEDLMPLQDAYIKESLQPKSAEFVMIPDNLINIEGENAKKLLEMIDNLEDNDDVQNVYTNMDISKEELEILGY